MLGLLSGRTAVSSTSSNSLGGATLRIPWLRLAAWFLGSRAIVWLVGMGSLFVVAKGPHFTPPVSVWDCFFRWDAMWHLDVAQNGYHGASASGPSNAVFLP